MNIVARKVEVYKVQNASGSVNFGLFKVVSEWEGMRKLQNIVNTDVMIVAPDNQEGQYGSAMKELFTFIKGEPLSTNFRVIFASPDLAAEIIAAKGKA